MSETLTDYLINVFGEYTPCIISDPSTGNIIESSINWGYICSVVIFCIVLFAVLKTIGGVIRAIVSR